MVSGRLHGIARYALELARVVPALAPDLAFEGLGPPGGLPELGPLAPGFPVHAAAAGFLAPLEQPALAAQLRRLGPALSTRRRSRCRSSGVARWWQRSTTPRTWSAARSSVR